MDLKAPGPVIDIPRSGLSSEVTKAVTEDPVLVTMAVTAVDLRTVLMLG